MKKRSFIQTIVAFFSGLFATKSPALVPQAEPTPVAASEPIKSSRELIGWGSQATPLDRFFCGEAKRMEDALNHWFRCSEIGSTFVVEEPIFSEKLCFEDARRDSEAFQKHAENIAKTLMDSVKSKKLLGPYIVQWNNAPSERLNPLSNIGRFSARTDWRVDYVETARRLKESNEIPVNPLA